MGSSLGDWRQWTQSLQYGCIWESFTGTSKQIALDALDTHLPDQVEHLDVLNTFGNHIGSGLTGNRRNASQDTTRRFICEPLGHHRPIDLHEIDGQLTQYFQAGIASAGVIEGQPEPQAPQALGLSHNDVWSGHRAFRDLQYHPIGDESS